MTVKKAIGKVISFLFMALAIINLAIFITTSAVLPVILMVICVICFTVSLKRKQYDAKVIAAELVAVLVLAYFMFSTSLFSGSFIWQYPFQRWYIEFMANDDTDGFFPDQLPADAKNFCTEYCPPLMQGNGYYYICFNTDNIDQFKSYTKEAILSFTMEEYANGLSEKHAARFNEFAEDGYGLEFYVDIPDCIDEENYNTEIYIINSNFYWNHPHTDIIFINYDEKLVCFSSVG